MPDISSSDERRPEVATAVASEPVVNSPKRLASPTQRRGETLLLLGPCALYLIVFSVYPLVASLGRSFMDYNQRENTWTWVGFRNYSELFHSHEFANTVQNTLTLTFAGVAIQVVLGTALALFFNQQLRGATIVRGIIVLPMLLTPIVVGLMWRALLNPEWGLLNWVGVKLGFGYIGWLSDPSLAHLDARDRRLLAVDAVRLRDRLRPPAGAAAGGVRGRFRRRRQLVPAHASTSRSRC